MFYVSNILWFKYSMFQIKILICFGSKKMLDKMKKTLPSLISVSNVYVCKLQIPLTDPLITCYFFARAWSVNKQKLCQVFPLFGKEFHFRNLIFCINIPYISRLQFWKNLRETFRKFQVTLPFENFIDHGSIEIFV